jgi:hypothetical protein
MLTNEEFIATEATAQDHADAAADAQANADAALAAGDYETAAHERGVAESEAGLAGSSDMLHGSSAAEFVQGDYWHDQAEYYEQQEAEHAAAGDYEAAREDAANAHAATAWADQTAGGQDHSDQSVQEYAQEDWAVWEQHTADENQQAADLYVATGDIEHAAQYEGIAADHQDAADYYGVMGEHDAGYASFDSPAAYSTDHSGETE